MTGYRSALFISLFVLISFLALGSGCSMNSAGGSGPDPNINNREFIIENIGVSTITDTTAIVSWNTSLDALSTLTLSVSPTSERYERFSPVVGTTHELLLAELAPSTDYFYKIKAADVNYGDTTSVGAKSFRTAIDSELLDTTPPIISDIEVINITSHSATITWVTDDRCNGEVYYGLNIPYEDYVVEQTEAPHTHLRSHSALILDLTYSTTYGFAIEATNVADRRTTSQVQSFTTAGMPLITFCPDNILLSEESDFEIVVCVSTVQDMGAISVEIQVDPTMVTITGPPQAGSFTDINEYDGHFTMASYNNPAGTALFEATWKIQMDGDLMLGTLADGDGEICIIPCKLRPGATSCDVTFTANTYIWDYLRYDVEAPRGGIFTITIPER